MQDKLTSQQAFDRNWQLFVVEKHKPCMDEFQRCLYWKDGHPGCGVGCLIDWEKVPNCHADAREFLGGAASFLALYARTIGEQFEHVRPVFLVELQNAHDTVLKKVYNGDCHFSEYVDTLRQIAEKYDLHIPTE